jgi:signal peptidase I
MNLQTLRQNYKSFFYPPEDKKIHFFIMDNFRTIIFALTVAMFIRTFFFEPFKIPSTSMVPTLRIGDFLFISKFDYGTKIPFTDLHFNKQSPKVGDVIVFDKDISNHGYATTYIKRVVATGGDEIEFKNSKIFLNGKLQDQKFDKEFTYQDQGGDVTSKMYTEYLGDIKHKVTENTDVIIPNVAKIKVPEGFVIVMGDNRDRSYDSRLWNGNTWGLVSEEEIRGRALFLFFSWDRHLKPRFDRFFDSLIPQQQSQDK